MMYRSATFPWLRTVAILALLFATLMPLVAEANSASGALASVASGNDPLDGRALGQPIKDSIAVELLTDIFGGRVWDGLFSEGAQIETGMVGAMSTVFNLIALGMTSLLVLWSGIVSLVSGNHDGEVVSKGQHGIWTPARMFFAVMLLVPFFGGYSLIQVAVLAGTYTGIGFADATYSYAITHLRTGTMTRPQIPGMNATAMQIVDSLACYHYLNSRAPAIRNSTDPDARVFEDFFTPGNMPKSREISLPGQAGRWIAYEFIPIPGTGIAPDACGKVVLRLEVPDGASDTFSEAMKQQLVRVHEQQQRAMDRLFRELNPIAQKAALSGMALAKYNEENSGAIERAADNYEQAMAQVASQVYQAAHDKNRARLDEFVERSKKHGFAMAGSWYWEMKKINQTLKGFVTTDFDVQGPNPQLIQASKVREGLQVVLNRTSNFYKTQVASDVYDMISKEVSFSTRQEPAGLGGVSGSGPIKGMWDNFWENVSFGPAIVELIASRGMSSEEAPEVVIMDMGHLILNIGWGLVIGYLGLLVIAKVGTGNVVGRVADLLSGSGGAINEFLSKVGIIVFLTWFPMMAFGGTLAYYVPMVPYILWFFGIIGWLLMVVESVVAAPIWAAAHSMPQGDGIAGQHARNGYMLMLNVITRPTLMLFGLFLAMLVMHAGYKFLLLTFFPTMRSVSSGKGMGIVGIIFMLGILVHMIMVLSHRSFELIHLIPERVSRWIGGGGEQLGETEQERKVHSGVVAVVGNTSKAAQNATALDKSGNGTGGPPGPLAPEGNDSPAETDADSIGSPSDNKIGQQEEDGSEYLGTQTDKKRDEPQYGGQSGQYGPSRNKDDLNEDDPSGDNPK